jgi:hypothetical protein
MLLLWGFLGFPKASGGSRGELTRYLKGLFVGICFCFELAGQLRGGLVSHQVVKLAREEAEARAAMTLRNTLKF